MCGVQSGFELMKSVDTPEYILGHCFRTRRESSEGGLVNTQ